MTNDCGRVIFSANAAVTCADESDMLVVLAKHSALSYRCSCYW